MNVDKWKHRLLAPAYFVYGMVYGLYLGVSLAVRWIDRQLDEFVEEKGLKIRG